MKKWKLLLSAIGAITPLAIATPFIVGCSSGGEEKQQTQAPTEEKQYRFYVIKDNPKNPTRYVVHKQVFDGYDDFFRQIWNDVSLATIEQQDWDNFVQKANEANIPIVFAN